MLTNEERGELLVLRAKADQVYWLAGVRELRVKREEAGAALAQAEAVCQQAEDLHTPLAEQITTLEARHAEAQRRLAEARLAEDSETDVSRLESAFMRRAALEKTEQKLAAKLTQARQAINPFTQRLVAARADVEIAREQVAALDEAITAPPFTHALAKDTTAYTESVLMGGEWLAYLDRGVRNTPPGKVARAIIMFALEQSGMGLDIQRTIEAGTSARLGGDDPRIGFLDDGTVIYNKNTIGTRDLTTGPDIRPADTRSAEQYMRQLRSDFPGWEGQPGMYVRPQDEPE